MKLSSYLEQQKLTPAAFGKKIRVSRQAVDRYIAGQRIPQPKVMKRIAAVTDGVVTPNDFYGSTVAAVGA